MTAKQLKNVAMSVRQRLLNKSKAEQRPFEELVRRFAMERFLYRLSQSEYKERLILKGALMFAVWKKTLYRPTLDIDMLGKLNNDAIKLENCIREICSVAVKDDGLSFDSATVNSEVITKDANYVGRRIRFIGKLENMRINMQIDVGFGDVVFPSPEIIEVPSFFEMPTGVILGYSRESAIAEKFHTMVLMAELNSRVKDFYDIWILCTSFDFDGERVIQAIKHTFDNRNTSIENEIVAFGSDFSSAKQDQWLAFRKKLNLVHSPVLLKDVIADIKKFLQPVVSFLTSKTASPKYWKAPDQWEF